MLLTLKMGQASSAEDDQESNSDSPRLYIRVPRNKWPIVYSNDYNISFLGLERVHPFDSGKWGRVFQILVKRGLLKGSEDTVQPLEANLDELALVHSTEYLDSLNVRFYAITTNNLGVISVHIVGL